MLVARLRRCNVLHHYIGMPLYPVVNRYHRKQETALLPSAWKVGTAGIKNNNNNSNSNLRLADSILARIVAQTNFGVCYCFVSILGGVTCFEYQPRIGFRYSSMANDDHHAHGHSFNGSASRQSKAQKKFKRKRKNIQLSTEPKYSKLPVDTTNVFEHTKELCDETIYPMSSLSENESRRRYVTKVFCTITIEAKRLLQDKYKLIKDTNPAVGNIGMAGKISASEVQICDAINLAFQLLIRVHREPSKTSSKRTFSFSDHKLQYINMVLQVWNVAALNNEPNLLSAHDVTQLVEQISHGQMNDIAAIGKIFQVAIHEAEPNIAPKQPTPKILLMYLYNAFMKANAKSTNSTVGATVRKMFDVIDMMRTKHSIQPDVSTYNILLRYLRVSAGGSFERFQSAFQLMQVDNIAPNTATYNEVVQCYTAKAHVTHETLALAEQYVKQMIDMILKIRPVRADDETISIDVRPQYDLDKKLIKLCAYCLMDAYKRDFMTQSSTHQQLETINRAKLLYLLIEKEGIFSHRSSHYLQNTIIYMYTRCGNVAAAKMMLTEIWNPTVRMYNDMITTYGKADHIEDSVEVFRMMLDDQRVIPNIASFTLLLEVCAKSKSLGHRAFDRATELLNMLGANERCVQLQLRPDTGVYNILLKCLLKSAKFKGNASAIALSILLEMEERHKTAAHVKPNANTFDLVLNVCSVVNDQKLMSEIINKMDDRLCNEILHLYATTATSESAEQADLVFSRFKTMCQTTSKISPQPNVYTYNILLNAWGRSNHPNYAPRMWAIYESMLSERVIPDSITYYTLLKHLTKLRDNIGMADKLLQESEKHEYNDGRYHPDYDAYAMVIKAYLEFYDAENATRMLFRWFGVARDRCTMSKDCTVLRASMSPLYHQLAQIWIQLGDLERATSVIENIHELYVDENNKQPTSIAEKTPHSRYIPEPPSVQTYVLLYHAWEKSCHQSRDEYLTKIKAKMH